MNRYILLLPVLLFMLTGCEQQPKYKMEIYVNTDTDACGIKDPMHNIDWLKDDLGYFDNYDYKFPIIQDYCIYNDSLGESSIVIFDYADTYLYVQAYTCDETPVVSGIWQNPYDFNPYVTATLQGPDIRYALNVLLDTDANHPVYYTKAPDCDECPDFFATHQFVDILARIRYLPGTEHIGVHP
ncbi:MAG: hypothetical protein ACI3Z7_02065 [Candidatus Aphodosoma sp.]